MNGYDAKRRGDASQAYAGFTVSHRAALARRWLFIGAVSPFAYSASLTASQAVSSVNSTQIIRGAVPLVCIIAALITRRPRPKRRGSVELWLAGFLLFALASTTWSVSSHATFLKAASLVSGYICIGLLVRYYDNLEHAMVGLLSFVHLLLLLTAFEALFLHHLAFQAAGSLNRLILVFPQTGSDVLATVCLVGLVGVVTNIGPRIMQGGRARVLLAGVYVTELLATRTRTALVLAGILLLLGAITWSRRSAHALPAVTGGIVVVIITLVLGGTALSAFFYRHETSGALATLTGRTVYWSEAVSAWKTSPLDGLGYYSGHREAVLTQPGQTTASNLDETWLETLVDTGVIGCTLLAGFALSGTIRLVRWRRCLSERGRWCLYALGVVALPITSFVNPTIQSNISPNFVLWGFLLLASPSVVALPPRAGSGSA